jgi:hypothetical protein
MRGRLTHPGRYRARPAIGRPTQPRRAAGGAAGAVGLRRAGSAQRTAGFHRRHHHARRTGGRGRAGPDRRRHHPADERRDPPGPPRPPLRPRKREVPPGHLRHGQGPGAVSHQTARLPWTANCVVRQGSRVFSARLRSQGLLLRSPPRHRLRHLPHHRRQRLDLRLRTPTPPPATRRLDHPQKRPTTKTPTARGWHDTS